jgi:ankyrin repeat protein
MSNDVNIIIQYMNDNKWDKILKNYDIKDTIINGNNILHHACIRGKTDVINDILLKNDNLYYVLNNEGDTCAHLLAKNVWYDILKDTYLHHKDVVTFKNDNNDTFIQILIDNNDMLDWIIDKVPDKYQDSFNNLSNNGYTVMLRLIEQNNLLLIEKLLKHNISLTVPENNTPLLFATINNKYDAVKLLLKNKADPNYKDSSGITPLIASIMDDNYDICKLLLKYNANINYYGREGDLLPLNLALLKKNNQFVKLLLDNNASLNITNRNLETPISIALKTDSFEWINPSYLFELIYKSNLDIPDINGITSLERLLKSNRWQEFSEALRHKKINLSANIKYVKNDDLIQFINTVSDGTILSRAKHCNSNINPLRLQKCRTYIKHIFLNRTDNDNNNMINMPKITKSNRSLFNSDAIHNCIYTVILLNMRTNLMIPYQEDIPDKKINDLMNLDELSAFRTPYGIIIKQLLSLYTEYFYEMSPYLILWRDHNLWYHNKDLKIYIRKILNNKKIRFIMLKLTLIPLENITHANVILYDKERNEAIRFDPYGPIDMNDEKLLDIELEKLLRNIFDLNKLKYIKPLDYMTDTKFQIVSNESNENNRKLGDPIGYCLAWTFWFIELRLDNPNIDISTLVKKSFNNILSDAVNSETNVMLDHIRNYASKLDKLKNQFLLDIGIAEDEIYNISYKDKSLDTIIKHINLSFNNIIKQ